MSDSRLSDSPDEAPAAEPGDPPDIEANVKNPSTWRRLLFMLVLGALYALSRPVVGAVVTLQFFWVLFTADRNEKLANLGHSLGLYSAELIDFLCFVTEERPFPFDKDWPDGR